MSRRNRSPLVERVSDAAAEALSAHNYVRPVDVMLGLGWLNGVLRDAPQHPVARRALADYYARAGKQGAEARK